MAAATAGLDIILRNFRHFAPPSIVANDQPPIHRYSAFIDCGVGRLPEKRIQQVDIREIFISRNPWYCRREQKHRHHVDDSGQGRLPPLVASAINVRVGPFAADTFAQIKDIEAEVS